MCCQRIVNRFLLFSLMIIPLFVSGQDSIASKELAQTKVEIILNESAESGKSGIKNRHVFILAGEKIFNLENLEKLFKEYGKAYPEPYNLRITVYSSKEMLQRLINFKEFSPIEFTEDEKGRKAAHEYYEKYYPLSKGYFRADYSRYAEFDFFDYSPKKEDSEMIRISLKK